MEQALRENVDLRKRLSEVEALFTWAKEFHRFLSKYAKSDHTVDIDRALSENPDNELIRKFAIAAKQDKINIEAAYFVYKKSLDNN